MYQSSLWLLYEIKPLLLLWIKSASHVLKPGSNFSQVLQQKAGEVDMLIIIVLQISSVYFVPNITEISQRL